MTNTQKPELLPCPFCGSKALLINNGNEPGVCYPGQGNSPDDWQVCCDKKGCLARHIDNYEYGAGVDTEDMYAVITAWNTRANGWLPIESAPKDGTWILGINNRGNQAVIIWCTAAISDFKDIRAGWIHPFSDMRLSSFWNGGCGSVPTHWMPLPEPPKVDD